MQNNFQSNAGVAQVTMGLPPAQVTVNAAFLDEIKEVNSELWRLVDDARKLCKSVLTEASQCQRSVALFDELRDMFALHFALEEAYGYFDDPSYVDARFSDRADSLRGEHRSLYQEIDSLADWVEQLHHERRLGELWSRVSARFAAFDDQLQAHENRENEMILEAFSDDIGAGD